MGLFKKLGAVGIGAGTTVLGIGAGLTGLAFKACAETLGNGSCNGHSSSDYSSNGEKCESVAASIFEGGFGVAKKLLDED